MNVTNDAAERNIALIQKYINSSKKEESRQNILIVVRENQKKVGKNASQNVLSKM